MKKVEIKSYVPGTVGRITELHASYYSEQWGFGQIFEIGIATGVSEFLNRFDKNRDGFWTVCSRGRVEGSIAIDSRKADSDGAFLRWFLISEGVRGQNLGNQLLEKAVNFCMEKERQGTQWGVEMKEQKLVLTLP